MKNNNLKSPFHIQMCSGNHNEHCDKFPHESIHEVYYDEKDRLVTKEGNLNIVPKNFKWKKIEGSMYVKSCNTCPNSYPVPYKFINGSCIRCWERIHISNSNGFGRDQYREYLREEFKREHNEVLYQIQIMCADGENSWEESQIKLDKILDIVNKALNINQPIKKTNK